MVVLDTQDAVRQVRNLDFCYLCGEEISDAEGNHDHVPPKKLFAVADRNFPLKLATHRSCHDGWSVLDETVGQLVAALHGRFVKTERLRLRLVGGRYHDGSPGVAAVGLNLPGFIHRCVRGFHAALYREPLPRDTAFMIVPPIPSARSRDDGEIEVLPIPDAAREFVRDLKRNRAAGTLDRVECNNNKCRYECTWTHADDGLPLCVFGFDIYDWKALGEGRQFPPRGGVGTYRPGNRAVPLNASRSTQLVFDVPNLDGLDPFGD